MILASNRGSTFIRGTEETLTGAHGIPPDLLARLLIIPTHPYNGTEIRQILSTRARLEFSSPAPPSLAAAPSADGKPAGGLVSMQSLADEALDELTRQGEKVSLRYALQLLAPAGILARARGSDSNVVRGEDIREAVDLFMDGGRSAGVLRDQGAGFIV